MDGWLFVAVLTSRYRCAGHGGAVSGPFRRLVASALAWVVGAVAAVGVGVLALSLIGDGLTSRTVQPLTPDVVARQVSAAPATPSPVPALPTPASGLAAASTPAPAEAPTATTAAAAGTEKLVTAPGGSAIARCSDGQVYLVSWSPAQGFRSDHVERGPALQASVRFESDDAKVTLAVRCVGGEPQATVSQRADDHGGGGHG
jgi:hypothetical protein